MTTTLGRLEQVDPRSVWDSEPGHFTPWLATEENLKLLGDTIGLDLELESQEKNVGPFRADILCKDTTGDHWVLIENQLERTDHTHLGQLITYAAGLKAVTIVWIADHFTDEHRAALDWLNEITDERFNFFGLEIELWKIGDSQVAPKFNIASEPNEWIQPPIRRGLTEKPLIQLEFWTAFREYVRDHGSPVTPTKPQPRHWMALPVGRAGFHLAAVALFSSTRPEDEGGHVLRAQLVTDGRISKAHFALLERDKEAIEAELGEKLIWFNPPDKQVCRIYVRRPAKLDDRSGWPEYHAWFLEKIEALHRVFAPRVKKLNADDYDPDGDSDE